MTERKWTKFKDGFPSQGDAVYVTDYKKVFLEYSMLTRGWEFFSQDYPEYAWSPIELPEVPREEKHRCEYYPYICDEESGALKLHLFVPGHAEAALASSVKYCPFCGYEAKR